MKPFILTIALLVAYSNSFTGPFIIDDIETIIHNPSIKEIGFQADPNHHGHIPTLRRPFVHFSLSLNYALSGYDTWSYHLFNFLIHLFTTLALFGVLSRSFKILSIQNYPNVPFYIALIWAVHPIQTECVSYITTRTESMSGLCYFLMFYSFTRWILSQNLIWCIASILCCFIGMGCKETMVTAPLILFFYDALLLTQSFKKTLKLRWKFYLLTASSWAFLISLMIISSKWEQIIGESRNITQLNNYNNLNFLNNFFTQSTVLSHYLKLIFWPDPLNVFYTTWALSEEVADCWESLIFILTILLIVSYGFFKKRRYGFLGISFFTLLSPTTFIPMPLEIVAERRMYIPAACVLILLIFIINRSLSSLLSKNPFLIIAYRALALSLPCLLCFLTWQRNKIYMTEENLWNSVIAAEPNSYFGHVNLGNILFKSNRNTEAIELMKIAAKIEPRGSEPWLSMGSYYLSKNQLDKAQEMFSKAIGLQPNPGKGFSGIGFVRLRQENYGEAEKLFKLSLKARYDHAHDVYVGLGDALFRQKKYLESIENYSQANQITPNHPTILLNLAAALYEVEKIDEALSLHLKVLSLDPYKTRIYTNLAMIYQEKKQYRKAKEIILQGHQNLLSVNKIPEANQLKAWGERNIK